MRWAESEFVTVTPGKYEILVEDASVGRSKSGADVMNIRVRVTSKGSFYGVEIKKSLPGWMVSKIGKALNMPRIEENGKAYYDLDGRDIISRKFVVTIGNREYPEGSGKFYNELGTDWEPGGVAPSYNPEQPDDLPF